MYTGVYTARYTQAELRVRKRPIQARSSREKWSFPGKDVLKPGYALKRPKTVAFLAFLVKRVLFSVPAQNVTFLRF